MVAYTKPQQRKKGEREKLRGDRDQIKFIDLGSCDRLLGATVERGAQTYQKEVPWFNKQGVESSAVRVLPTLGASYRFVSFFSNKTDADAVWQRPFRHSYAR